MVISFHGEARLRLAARRLAADAGSRFGILHPAMAKRPTKPEAHSWAGAHSWAEAHSWAVYHLKGGRPQFADREARDPLASKGFD
jgi:hypothetical protein